jgi:hypothetical protein
MIKVELPEPDLEEWIAWRTKAEQATLKLVSEGPPYRIRDELYKEMRHILFSHFHQKCAYCECEFSHNQPGDVEHYRPKKGVVDEFDEPVRSGDDGAEREHPGYYWLAYEWDNLLPACEGCNRLSKAPGGKLVGKGTRFPVLAGEGGETFRAWHPGAELQETPVFIHPVREDPAEHLQFDPLTGLMIGITERGQRCIDLLGLNRDALVELRIFYYRSVKAKAMYAAVAGAEEAASYVAYLQDFCDGTMPFSLAGRVALRDAQEHFRPVWEVCERSRRQSG